MNPPGRTVSLVLTAPNGAVLGRLPPVAVATPWWQDVAPINWAIRARDGLDVVILRLLHADRPHPPGGSLTYLAEVSELCAAEPWSGAIDDDPRRMSYARPGGPAADLAWAQSVMVENGIELAGKPEQVRSWNLSSLWRLRIFMPASKAPAVPSHLTCPLRPSSGRWRPISGGQVCCGRNCYRPPAARSGPV